MSDNPDWNAQTGTFQKARKSQQSDEQRAALDRWHNEITNEARQFHHVHDGGLRGPADHTIDAPDQQRNEAMRDREGEDLER